MKFIRLCCAFLAAALLAACTYTNKLPGDIFAAPTADPQVAKSVLLVSDKVAQKQFVFKDYHSSDSVHSYTLKLAQGSLIAAADALGTLFETVEVNPSKYAPQYDYRAELVYTVGSTKTDSDESVQWFGAQPPPILQTRVMIYIYNTQTDQLVFSMFASRQNRVELTDATATAQRVETKGKTLFLPVTGPVYTQQFGDNLRYTLARDLSQCLTEIAQTLEQNRALFEPATQNNVK